MSPGGSFEDDRAVAQLFESYVIERDSGCVPDREAYLGRCSTSEGRRRLQECIAELDALERLLPESAAGSPLPAQIGSYAIEGEIGRGGMGVVYAAVGEDGRRAAVKLLHDAQVREEGALRRFEREVRALSQLRHPAVVRIRGHGVSAGRPYLVMERLPGGTLADRIYRRRRDAEPPTEAEVRERCRLFAKLARGAAGAHAAGVVHRDIKPSNVLFDAAGEPVLCDFGLAHFTGSAGGTVSINVLGTLPYLAPERLLDPEAGGTPAVDVYSLGVMLFELLTGWRPFGGSLSQVLASVRKGRPPTRIFIGRPFDRGLEAILDRCLSARPAHRYPSATGLANDLDAWLAGREVQALRGWAWRRFAARLRRHPLLALLAVLVLLAAGAWQTHRALVRATQGEARLRSLAQAGPLVDEFETQAAAIWELLDQRSGGDRRNDWSRTLEFLRQPKGLNPRKHRLDELRSDAESAYSAALSALQDALEVGGGDPVATELLTRLRFAAARLHEREGRWERAEEEWSRYAAAAGGGGLALPTAAVVLEVAPPGTRVTIHREDRAIGENGIWTRYRLSGEWSLGEEPLQIDGLDPGSYVFELRRPDGERTVRLPLLLGRGETEVVPPFEVPPDDVIGADWEFIPPGTFVAGGDPRAPNSEARAYRVLDGYFIKRREEIFAEYLLFLRDLQERRVYCDLDSDLSAFALEEGLPIHAPHDSPYGSYSYTAEELRTGELPSYFGPECSVHQIAPYDAQHYVAWLNRRAERDGEPWVYSLPTGDEWEKAARGADGRPFPWGHGFRWELTRGGFTKESPDYSDECHLRPGCYPGDRSPFELLDVAGNVREICSDFYGPPGGSELQPRWLVRGGEESFYVTDEFRLAARYGAILHEDNWDFGFRLVRRRREPGR